MSWLEKNLEFLSPDVRRAVEIPGQRNFELVKTRSGHRSLRVDGVSLHSLYDPIDEAAREVMRWKESVAFDGGDSTVVVFGFGLGYHLEVLLDEVDCPVYVYEGRKDVLRFVLESRDLSSILERVALLVEPELPPVSGGFSIFSHRPSLALAPDFYSEVERKLTAWREVSCGLKILLVGPIQGGAYPIALFVKRALEEMGHEVFFLDFSSLSEGYTSLIDEVSRYERRRYLRNLLEGFGSELVVEKALEWEPDLVFALAQAPILSAYLEKLRAAGIPTVFWFVENYRHLDYWKDAAPFYDYFFTIQRGEFHDELKRIGAVNFAYFPLGCLPSFHRPMELSHEDMAEYGADVSFVGAGYYNRHVVFQGILDFPLKIWGNEWNLNSPLGRCVQRGGARVTPEEMVKIFNATKVNLNLHSSAQHPGIDPCGDFVNPRTFEISACGAFQLVDERSELANLFEVDKEMITFSGIEDLRDKIRYYLEHPGEREEVAKRSRERVLAEHTYSHRLEGMFRFMVERGFVPALRGMRGKDLRALLKECREYPELIPLFRYVGGKRRISIDDLAETIRDGKGHLTSVEKILLLLKEVKDQMMGVAG